MCYNFSYNSFVNQLIISNEMKVLFFFFQRIYVLTIIFNDLNKSYKNCLYNEILEAIITNLSRKTRNSYHEYEYSWVLKDVTNEHASQISSILILARFR